MDSGEHLAEVGALASHPVHFFLVDLRIRQDEFCSRKFLLFFQLSLDTGIDTFESLEKRKVPVSRQGIQALDHPKRMKDRAGGHGSHISHSEDLLAQELLLDVRDDVEIVLIGGEQVLEAGVLESKDLVEVLF
jgi:hypothetical protein